MLGDLRDLRDQKKRQESHLASVEAQVSAKSILSRLQSHNARLTEEGPARHRSHGLGGLLFQNVLLAASIFSHQM